MKFFLSAVCLILINLNANAQAKTRKLPNNINHPSINVYAPYMSFDANALVFLSDNGDESTLSMVYSLKENSDWKDPVVAPKQINTRLNFLRGYALSADGRKIYFASMKSPGVGGYDILVSELKGSTWSDPQNFGVPINSRGHEACPSFTFDGNAVYFMRCEKMNADKAENCKLFVAKKKSTGQWEEPVELPATINTGNTQTPRIMADGETLIFSSDKFPDNKGGMDLYVTKLSNGNWSAPVALDFVNTPKDDQYITVNALGRYLIKDTPGTRKSELVEYLIPNDIRPKGVMKINGTVTDPAGGPVPAYISVVDLVTKKRVYSGRPLSDGSFLFYLIEGSMYELSVDPEQSNYNYFSKQFDLTSDKIPQAEKVNIVLKTIAPGDELSLDVVKFKPNSSELDASSFEALKRLVRIMKQAPNLKFQIQVLLTGYQEDTYRSSAELTEMIVDSTLTKFDDIDSLGQLYQRDTVIVKKLYHNDRTQQQAKAVANYLISQGADANSLSIFGNAIEATMPEKKRTIVKAAVSAK